MGIVLIDPEESCRRNEKYQGCVQVADLKRLSTVCANQDGELQWSAKCSISPAGHLQLDITVEGRINLDCQRCLDVFPFDLDSKTSILIANSEEEADEIEDALAKDDPTEVIVGSENMDILVLVEDEVLLTIPFSPRHDTCPDTVFPDFSDKKESPFSILHNLKISKKNKN